MHRHRLDRLALLTKGAALVGFGLSSLACGKDEPPKEPIHINATATPMPPADLVPDASASAGSADATATPPPDAPSGSAPKPLVPLRPRMNAPPRTQPDGTPKP